MTPLTAKSGHQLHRHGSAAIGFGPHPDTAGSPSRFEPASPRPVEHQTRECRRTNKIARLRFSIRDLSARAPQESPHSSAAFRGSTGTRTKTTFCDRPLPDGIAPILCLQSCSSSFSPLRFSWRGACDDARVSILVSAYTAAPYRPRRLKPLALSLVKPKNPATFRTIDVLEPL